MEAKAKSDARLRRHARVRKKVRGEAERPRLAVYRSNWHIYAQLIDDRAERTLAAASDTEVTAANPTERAKAASPAQKAAMTALTVAGIAAFVVAAILWDIPLVPVL